MKTVFTISLDEYKNSPKIYMEKNGIYNPFYIM